MKVIDGVQAEKLLWNSDIHGEVFGIYTNSTDDSNY